MSGFFEISKFLGFVLLGKGLKKFKDGSEFSGDLFSLSSTVGLRVNKREVWIKERDDWTEEWGGWQKFDRKK